MNLLMEFQTVTCPHCGVTFALAQRHAEILRRDEKMFQCPNGHELFLPNNSGPSREELLVQVAELKQRVVQLTHELDQMQARREHGHTAPSANEVLSEDPDPAEASRVAPAGWKPIPRGNTPEDAREFFRRTQTIIMAMHLDPQSNGFHCPYCKRVAKRSPTIFKHLRKDHLDRLEVLEQQMLLYPTTPPADAVEKSR